jgi:hypothetical protein
MSGEEQRQFAKTYISAFLEATLRDDRRYLPLFRDHRVASNWLPKTMYTTRFEESSYRPVATFEEDIDVTTGSLPGVAIRGDSLATWRESRLQLRTSNTPSEGTSQYNNALTVGWNNRLAGEDTTRMGPPASVTIELPLSLARDWGLASGGSLQFLLMPTDAMPGPRAAPRDSTQADSTARRPPRRPRPQRNEDEEKPPVDLSIEVRDASGTTARLPLSRYGAIRRPLESWISRRRDQERSRFGSLSELVLQTFVVPLSDFAAAEPGLDLGSLTAVRFVFDRAVAGTVVIDDIGFAVMDPAWLAAR